MTNKEIIQIVNEGFAGSDNEKIMQYVADDVRWDLMGTSVAIGKEAFLKEINNEYFVGNPVMKINHQTEHDDRIFVEGEIQCKKIDGSVLDAFFIDVYCLKNGLIKEMRSYIVQKSKAFY